jgi:hypothetical protein
MHGIVILYIFGAPWQAGVETQRQPRLIYHCFCYFPLVFRTRDNGKQFLSQAQMLRVGILGNARLDQRGHEIAPGRLGLVHL